MRKLMKLLSKFLPHTFEIAWVMGPLGPARGNRPQDEIHVGGLPLIFEHLRVVVVLNAVADGLQSYPRRGLAGSNRSRRIEKNPVAGSADAWTTGVRVHVVPASEGVSSCPSVSAVVKNSGGALRPVQESRLDALIDRRVVRQPFRSVAVAGVTTGIAPKIASACKRECRPSFH